jgi:hypothetical protein
MWNCRGHFSNLPYSLMVVGVRSTAALGVGPDTGQARWLIEKIDLASVKLRSRYTVEEGP